MDLLWIAARFISKSVVLGLAIAALWMLFWQKPAPIGIRALPDQQHNIVCFVTSTGSISCLNVVLST